jgi:hypothetical protein
LCLQLSQSDAERVSQQRDKLEATLTAALYETLQRWPGSKPSLTSLLTRSSDSGEVLMAHVQVQIVGTELRNDDSLRGVIKGVGLLLHPAADASAERKAANIGMIR